MVAHDGAVVQIRHRVVVPLSAAGDHIGEAVPVITALGHVPRATRLHTVIIFGPGGAHGTREHNHDGNDPEHDHFAMTLPLHKT
ncbi:MAG: hypothetical protein JJLCMIEE_01342 [Acidimicrobiales bacterium]|nr:MAG: hypothetical protein EDR02_17240 [Actinomycetota bacterium]MBV6508282.1 hypothetical protein [Acidimicrobiales bacterium]